MTNLDARAVREGWNLSPEERREVLDANLEVIRQADGYRSVAAASRVLVAADSVNVRREAIASRERRNQLTQNALILREALSIPEIRSALCRLTQQVIQGTQQPQQGHETTSDDDSPSEPT